MRVSDLPFGGLGSRASKGEVPSMVDKDMNMYPQKSLSVGKYLKQCLS